MGAERPPTGPRSVVLISEDFAPKLGGLAAHVEELGRALQTLNLRVTVLTNVHSEHRVVETEMRGLPVVRLPTLVSKSRWSQRVQLRWRLAAALDRLAASGEADVLHWHTLEHLSWALGPISGPKVFTNHTSHFSRAVERGRARRLLRKIAQASAVIAPSQRLYEDTKAVGFPADRVFHIPNGVDPELFGPRDRGSALLDLGLEANTRAVLFAGRIERTKGADLLIRAIEQLHPSLDSTVKFIIAGDGSRAERQLGGELLQAKDALIRAGRVVSLGPVSRQRMPDLFRASRLFVSPSRHEGTSLAILESLASAVPVIATRVGGTPEILSDGEEGWLIPTEDASALAAKIEWALSSPETLDEAGARGRARALETHSWQRIAERTLEVYSSALAMPPRDT